MGIEVGWLPGFGYWTDVVHGTVVAGMAMAGAMCCVAFGLRAYRVLLQVLAWAMKK